MGLDLGTVSSGAAAFQSLCNLPDFFRELKNLTKSNKINTKEISDNIDNVKNVFISFEHAAKHLEEAKLLHEYLSDVVEITNIFAIKFEEAKHHAVFQPRDYDTGSISNYWQMLKKGPFSKLLVLLSLLQYISSPINKDQNGNLTGPDWAKRFIEYEETINGLFGELSSGTSDDTINKLADELNQLDDHVKKTMKKAGMQLREEAGEIANIFIKLATGMQDV